MAKLSTCAAIRTASSAARCVSSSEAGREASAKTDAAMVAAFLKFPTAVSFEKRFSRVLAGSESSGNEIYAHTQSTKTRQSERPKGVKNGSKMGRGRTE